MATPLTNKIVLKNTTKMSLNERFTVYRKQARNNPTAVEYRQKMQRVSSKNLKLAQQMVNRPSVRAALRLKKKSMQQRLGRPVNQQQSNVKSRLTFAKRFMNVNDNAPVHNRLGIIRGRGGKRGNRGNFRPGTSPLIRARLGQSNFNNFSRPSQRGGFQANNRSMRGRGNNRFQGQRNVRNFNNRNVGRGNVRGGRFQGSRGRNLGPPPSKQDLDNQLDEYMAAHTGVLDAQLGQYM